MNKLKIIAPDGISKVVNIEKTITSVGYSPKNDIELESSDIASLQLQIISSPELPTSCRVVNYGAGLKVERQETDFILGNYQSIEVQDKDEIFLGSYRVQFYLPLVTNSSYETASIQASLMLPEPILHPKSTITANLTVKNISDNEIHNFEVKMNGLPLDCLLLDNIPPIAPGSQKVVSLRISHRGISPKVGFHTLTLTISASAGPLNDPLTIRQGVYVMPVFSQKLEIRDENLSDPNQITSTVAYEEEN